MEVAYRLRCPDPRVVLALPDETLDVWIEFLNERASRVQELVDRLTAQGAGMCAVPYATGLLDP